MTDASCLELCFQAYSIVDYEGSAQSYLFSSNTRNMIPSESAATETNNSPTQTSGAGF